MTNLKSTKRALVSSVIALLVCFTVLLGTTFAWFTDFVSSGINKIQSGTLEAELWHSSYASSAETSQFGLGFGYSEEKGTKVDENTQLFLSVDGQNPVLWEPGAAAVENFRIKNEGTLALKFKFKLQIANATKTPNGNDLTDILQLYIDELSYADNGVAMGTTIVAGEPLGDGYVIEGELLPGENYDFWVGLEWEPTANDNEYNVKGGLSLDLCVVLVATQLSYENDGYDGKGYDSSAQYPEIPAIPDVWDGGIDLSWYDPNATEYYLDSAEALAGLAALANGNVPSTYSTDTALGELPVTFKDKIVYLNSDVNLYNVGGDGEPISFEPIGGNDSEPFKGTFDGQGHTIDGLYQSGWAFGYEWGSYGSIGLFGEIDGATIKNVTINGAECLVEGGDIGGITGSATGDCIFENITIKDSVFATYNNGNGGIIGWSGEGSYTFKNITIAEDVVLAGLWGSFDSSIGGVVGQGEPGATYIFENVDVACRIDAYNDCTASYDYYNYRMCGMLIGRLEETVNIDGANYPDTTKYNIVCTDVTVTYGDWANYHYCDPTPGLNGGRGMRVEAGYSYDGLPDDYDHSTCTTHCKELIEFDQIFGGDQLGVKGLKAYAGVEVIYNNK